MISVSYIKSKFDKNTTIKMIDDSSADMIHVDLMDGLYVENNNFTINEVINDLKDVSKPLEFHLMVNNPEYYIDDIAKLRPLLITVHYNTTDNMEEVLERISEYNIKVGIAINPQEDIHIIDNYIDKIDYVLIMGVNPGYGGQPLIKEVLDKIDYVKEKNLLVGIDGGVNDETIYDIEKKNPDIIVSGSFVCGSDDFNLQINKLRLEVNE